MMDYAFEAEDAPRELARTRIAAFKHLQDLAREHEPFTESAKAYLAHTFKKKAEEPKKAADKKLKKPDIEIPKTIIINLANVDEMIAHRREMIDGCTLPRSAKLLILPILEKHGMRWAQVMRPDRRQKIVKIKHEIWHVLASETKLSIAEIARRCGVDHTTVLHGLGKLARQSQQDIKTCDTIQQQSL